MMLCSDGMQQPGKQNIQTLTRELLLLLLLAMLLIFNHQHLQALEPFQLLLLLLPAVVMLLLVLLLRPVVVLLLLLVLLLRPAVVLLLLVLLLRPAVVMLLLVLLLLPTMQVIVMTSQDVFPSYLRLPAAVVAVLDSISNRWPIEVLLDLTLPAAVEEQEELLGDMLLLVLQGEVPAPLGCNNPACVDLRGGSEVTAA